VHVRDTFYKLKTPHEVGEAEKMNEKHFRFDTFVAAGDTFVVRLQNHGLRPLR
jgi:hypothetical protein